MFLLVVFLCSLVSLSIQSDGFGALLRYIADQEQILDDLIAKLQILYSQRCSFNCSCYKRFCPQYTPFHSTQCSTAYGNPSSCSSPGRMLDFSSPSVILPTLGLLSDELKTVLCWSSGIGSHFANYSKVSWRYLGTPQGIFVGYPGSYSANCTDYDPRTRPWYVAATSGPKDVIILMDVSEAMAKDNKISLAKEAAFNVLDTLTMNDYVGVIWFSSGASIVGSPSGHLLQASKSNLVTLRSALQTISPEGETNYEVAFQTAFQMINTSRREESTSGCESLILFLTGGGGTVGAWGEELLALISNLNSKWKAKIFTYSLGSNTDVVLPKAISCANQGIWAQITGSEGGDIASQMGNYFNYLASHVTNRNLAVWTEPYEDQGGVGRVITFSKPFYDVEVKPPLLLGVVGVDLPWSDFQAMEYYSQDLLYYVVYRSAVCSEVTLDDCALEFLRYQVVNQNGVNSTCFGNLTCTPRNIPQQNCTQPERDPGFCNMETNFSSMGECCTNTSTREIVPIIVGCVVGGFFLIVGGVLASYFIFKNLKQSPGVDTTIKIPQESNPHH